MANTQQRIGNSRRRLFQYAHGKSRQAYRKSAIQKRTGQNRSLLHTAPALLPLLRRPSASPCNIASDWPLLVSMLRRIDSKAAASTFSEHLI